MSADHCRATSGTQLSQWLGTSAFNILDRCRLAVAGARFCPTSKRELVVASKETDRTRKQNLSPNDIQIHASEE
ncbi:hypothetical protein BDN67DRAFT_974602 [Paxillus ammoniavirescens]|nr:hypothetical protein BDN67DRAFT_974602 [Paxillus ammoniavirescens]